MAYRPRIPPRVMARRIAVALAYAVVDGLVRIVFGPSAWIWIAIALAATLAILRTQT